MLERTPICFIIAILFLVPNTYAEDRRPIREARSENGRFELQIRPGRPGGESSRPRAALLEHTVEGRRGRKIWSGKLENEVAPREVAIRNDGRFVVTLDEFRRGGAAHAAVIYDKRGKLLRDFGLRELLSGDDWKHITVDRRAVVWLEGAKWAFVDEPPAFLIKLKWKREIRIDLQTLAVVDSAGKHASTQPSSDRKDQASSGQGAAAIPPEILALLEHPTSAAAGGVAGDDVSAEAVQEALENLQRLAAVSEVEIGAGKHAAGAGESATDAAATEASAEFESSIPQPDPANPVDYVAWVMEQTETEGPSAIPFYEAAVEALVEWEGDPELFDKAMDGDPAALASPEIAAWIEANRDALASYRSAVDYEYRGWLQPSEDGSVIGILLPNLSKQRQLAKTAIVEARIRDSQGDYAGALDIYGDTLASGAQISHGPTLIENLVGIAVQSVSSDSLLDSLATDREGVDYAELAESLEHRYQPTRRIADAMDGERAMVFDSLQRLYEYDEETGAYFVDSFEARDELNMMSALVGNSHGSAQLAIPFLLGAFDFESTVATTNEYYDNLISGAAEPYQQAMQSLEQLESQTSKPEFQMRNPMLTNLLPALSRAVHAETRGEAARRATILTANLKAYRQKYGDYPPSLDTFADREMAYDPFTGGQFVYQRDGDGFRLYSLGGNGVDDGGVHDRRADENDYVFWPRPTKE